MKSLRVMIVDDEQRMAEELKIMISKEALPDPRIMK